MAGRKMLESIKDPYIAANVNVPRDASAFIELCKLDVPKNAVNCIINATPSTRMFFQILQLSFG